MEESINYSEDLTIIIERLDSILDYIEVVQYTNASIYTAHLFVIGVLVSVFVMYFLYKAIKQLF